MRNRIIGLAIFALVVFAAVGAQYFLRARGTSTPGGTGTTTGKAVVTLKGYVGGEKVGLLDDPDVQRILAEKYGLKLDATKAGSFEMVDLATASTDFLFPSSKTVLEYLKDKEGVKSKRSDVVLSSPIVIYSWKDIAEAFIKQGLVKKVNDTYYIVDMPKLVQTMEEGKTWADVGVPSVYGKVKVISTDPEKSNSGNQFAALLADIMAGDVVDDATLPKVLPRLKKLYDRLGYLDSSSGDLFSQYLRLGEGANPMVASYENQIIEFAATDPGQWQSVKGRVAVLYPQPTVWSEHVVIALTDAAVPLIAAMKDPEIQRIAWERHGFRTGVGGAKNVAPKGVTGLPATVDKVVPMPRYSVMRSIMNELR
jgi:hypothetical protein